MKLVRELSKGLLLTFHRAFDVCSEPHHIVLEQIIALGCDRLLTSGGAQSNVLLNLPALAAVQHQAAGRIEIVAAAGVCAENVEKIIRGTGVRAVHAGSSVTAKTITTEKTYGNKVEKKPVSPPAVPISPKDSVKESYVDVFMERSNSDSARTTPQPAANAGAVSNYTTTANSTVDELLCWSCVSENLVFELVACASAAFNNKEAGAVENEQEVLIGKDYSAGVLEGSYIHL